MTYDEGEGIAFADLELSRVLPPKERISSDTFWIEPLPSNASKAWERLVSFGQNYYSTVVKPTLAQELFAHPKRQAGGLQKGSSTETQRAASQGCWLRVNRVVLTMRRSLPVYPD